MSYQSKKHYPDTEIYVNKLDIRDQDQLEKAERRLTALRQIELDQEPLSEDKWNLKHLQKIHKYLFQDVYDFAGDIRTEQIQKGHTQFANPLFLEDYAKDVFNQLKNEKYLKDLPKDKFCERLAYYMGEINMVHPFYEGNGRSTREFIRNLAMKNGYTLDWNRLDKDVIMNTSIKSIVDTKPLEKHLNEAIVEQEPSKELIKGWKNYIEYQHEL